MKILIFLSFDWHMISMFFVLKADGEVRQLKTVGSCVPPDGGQVSHGKAHVTPEIGKSKIADAAVSPSCASSHTQIPPVRIFLLFVLFFFIFWLFSALFSMYSSPNYF